MTRVFVRDVLERLIKTFGQAFAGAIVATWASSGLNLANANDWSLWVKLLGPAVVAGLAAMFSVLTSLASGLKTDTASASMIVATTAATPGNHASSTTTVGTVSVRVVPVLDSTSVSALPALPGPALIVSQPLPVAPAVIVADPITPA